MKTRREQHIKEKAANQYCQFCESCGQRINYQKVIPYPIVKRYMQHLQKVDPRIYIVHLMQASLEMTITQVLRLNFSDLQHKNGDLYVGDQYLDRGVANVLKQSIGIVGDGPLFATSRGGRLFRTHITQVQNRIFKDDPELSQINARFWASVKYYIQEPQKWLKKLVNETCSPDCRRELTKKQQIVLKALQNEADQDGICRFMKKAVAYALGLSRGGLAKMLTTLQELGYIEMLNNSKGQALNTVKILRE